MTRVEGALESDPAHPDHGSRSIGRQQSRHRSDERMHALRALLMHPLMTPSHEAFAAVRRHADELRAWFARETGWALHIERDCARLYKLPADLSDTGRGLPGYDRRRYVLLCLACAVLERADPQITLHVLGERLLTMAADPALHARGFEFTLGTVHERRELVAVCRTLLDLGVLQRVAGDEDGYVRGGGSVQGADALYDVRRRALASVLAAVRGPSTYQADQAPADLESRLRALVTEHQPDSDEGRRTALRHHLARRLLDDPVVYLHLLADDDLRAYFINQRGPMASRLCEATGLVAEQRAEGLALSDEVGELTDIAMPAEGTEAHVTLLVAEFLSRARSVGAAPDLAGGAPEPVPRDDVVSFIAAAREQHGSFWRKSAREPGAERELASLALDRLHRLRLASVDATHVHPLPALARFALGNADVRTAGGRSMHAAAQTSLFE